MSFDKLSFTSMTDQAVAEVLGTRLAQLRLEHNFTQQHMADEVGLSRLSYRKLEGGEGKLVNFIAALRVLGRIDALAMVLPEETFSPMQQLKLQGKVRQRARGETPARGDKDEPQLDW